MGDIDWYYLDLNGTQVGPVPFPDVKTAWKQKLFNKDSLIWNENMDSWEPVGTLPNILKDLEPAKMAPPGRPPVRAAPARQSNHRRGASSAITDLADSFANPTHASATLEQSIAEVKEQTKKAEEPEERATAWKEFVTPEGVKYYHNSDSGQTTWDKPDVLKTPEEMDKKGEWVWFPDGSQAAFVPARVTSRFHDGRIQVETEDGESHVVKKKVADTLEVLQWSHLRRLEKDLVMLDVMNKPLIIYNLRNRFQNNEIYTNVGTILISCNPYKMLPLYSPAMIDKYRHRGTRQLDPHVFEIADNAFNNIMEFHQGQSIVISGESGAGKTEATKQCLQYLAEVAGSESNVEQKILVANPILEAFGNAKTVRNNNSSRFGKYVEIFFDGRGRICGARNTNYLLEKSRVVFQNEGERNYHIFYMLCRGGNAKQQRDYGLRDPETFFYLAQSTTDVDGMDDVQEFAEVENAMELLEFKQSEREALLEVVAGVMHLGDIDFQDVGDRKCQVGNNRQALQTAARLLQVDAGALESTITTKILRMRGSDPITVTLSAAESVDARDALAKFIYDKMFDWLVGRINQSIGAGKPAKGCSIGILDIFGFEIFKKNSFEQLCINYANEMLQQYFNNHTFSKEESIYKSEKIKFVHVEYIDNQPVLDLIEKRPRGVLPMIDEEIRIPRGSDKTYVAKLLQTHKDNPHFGSVLSNPEDFIVYHYAGGVHYESHGFLEKNKDRLPEDTLSMITSTQLGFLRNLFGKEAGRDSKDTLGRKFSKQLSDLMHTLNQTEPHYIRCVKPNQNKAPLEFDANMVLEQLQYAGVFEAIQIRKSGYPFRLTHEQFTKRFKCIMPKKNFRDYKAGALTLIQAMKQSTDLVQIGMTRVLYRAEQHREMELIRNVAVERTVIYIQRWVRRYLCQRLIVKMREAQPKLRKALADCKRSRQPDDIDKAVQIASHITPFFEMKEVTELKWLKHVIVEEQKISVALRELLTKDPEKNYEALSRAVASANEINLQSAEADRARQIVAEIKEKRAVAAALKAGVEEFDEDKLRLNLEKAQQLGVQENVDRAYEMLCALIEEKQYLYDNAYWQLQVLEEEAMQDIISRADGINYSIPEIERIRELLLDTPEDKFVQMQLKAAIANNDPDRAIRVTIRLKDIFFEKQGDMFVFSRFGVLRSPLEWANMKFLSFNKEELAAGQLFWTKNPIHASLTQLDSRHNKMAKICFKNILGYMGDRQYDGPESLARELLQTCLENAGIRDEVYCQLIKQLTRNPNGQSTNKGWQLMLMCMNTFPPLSQFENFLEMYIRKNAPEPADLYLRTLHMTIYGGPLQYTPSLEQIIACANQKKPFRDFDLKYTAEEKAEAKEALAFGGHGPAGAPARPQMPNAPADNPAPPGRAPPSGPPPGRSPPSGPPPGRAPPSGPPPGARRGAAPSRGAPPGRAPPAGRPPAGRAPPRGAPPGRGPPPGRAPPRGAPPGRSAPGRAPPRGAPPGRAPPRGAPPGRAPPRGAPPGRAPPRGAPPGRAPPRGAPPGRAPPRGAPPGRAPPRGAPPGRAPPRGAPPGRAPPRGPPPSRRPPRAAPQRAPMSARPAMPGQQPSGPARGFQLPAGAFRMPGAGGPGRGGPAIPPKPAPKPKPASNWKIVTHPDTGQEYYWNTVDNRTSWDKPADF